MATAEAAANKDLSKIIDKWTIKPKFEKFVQKRR